MKTSKQENGLHSDKRIFHPDMPMYLPPKKRERKKKQRTLRTADDPI